MRVLCAPDGYRDSMSATTAARAMALGVRDAGAEADICPVADGGEGFREAISTSRGGREVAAEVLGPTGRPLEARFGLLPERAGEPITAAIAMSDASGLELTPPAERDPTRTTTFGTGQLVRRALDLGAGRILFGLGGSATNDGGCGMAQALGVRFRDRDASVMPEPFTGGMLERIAAIDLGGLDARLETCVVSAACDVRNPLTGPDGAAFVYAPQKGATPDQVRRLDAGLAHLAAVLRQQLGMEVADREGAGAAGGLGAGAIAFLGADLVSGVETVLEAVGFVLRVRACDLCLTGEGRLDAQTLAGKAVLGVARAARGVPVHALVGSRGLEDDGVLEAGLAGIHVIGQGLPLEESLARGPELLREASRRLVRRLASA